MSKIEISKLRLLLKRHSFSTRIELNANDTFAFACADSVVINEDGLFLFVECHERWGNDGVTAFMAAVRGEAPIQPWITDKYVEAKEWLHTQSIPTEVENE